VLEAVGIECVPSGAYLILKAIPGSIQQTYGMESSEGTLLAHPAPPSDGHPARSQVKQWRAAPASGLARGTDCRGALARPSRPLRTGTSEVMKSADSLWGASHFFILARAHARRKVPFL
jgi:hypothetical protein